MFDSNCSDAEVLGRFAGIVARSLRIDPEQVTPDAYLDDLGAESLDYIEIVMDTEEEFHISIPEKNILEAGREIFGEGILEKEGILTEDGKKLLLHRLTDLKPAQLEGEISVADARRHLTRVGSWIRMIRGLMDYTPKNCEKCGGTLSGALAGRMKCDACGHEVDIPLGDDINKQWIQKYYENEYLPARASSEAPQI